MGESAVQGLSGEHAFELGVLPRVRSIERRLSGVFDDDDDCDGSKHEEVEKVSKRTRSSRPRSRSRFLIFSKTYARGLPECAVRSAVRGAMVGYAFRAAVGFFPVLLKSLMRRKFLAREMARGLLGQQQFEYARFFSVSFTAFNSFMYLTRGSDSDSNSKSNSRQRKWKHLRALIAGVVLGGPPLLLAPKTARTSIALFFFARALEVACKLIAKRHPQMVVSNPRLIAFSLANAQILFCWMFQRDALQASFVRFMDTISALPSSVTLAASDIFRGSDLSPPQLAKINTTRIAVGARALVPSQVNNPQSNPLPLLLYPFFSKHASFPLARGFLHHLILCMKVAIRVYIPVYLIPMLIRPASIAKRPLVSARRFVVNVLRSALFCSANVSVCGLLLASFGLLTSRRSGLGPLSGWLGGLFGGAPLLLEKESRRTELALYWLPLAFKAYRKVAEKFGIATIRGRSEAALQVSLYGASLGLILHACTQEPDCVRPTYMRIISYLLETE